MKKILSFFLVAVGLMVNAQNDLPKSVTDVSPLLIGEKIPNTTLKIMDNSSVDLQIFAISPGSPKNLKATEAKDKVNYLLLSDSYGELTKAMGIVFQAPENYKTVLAKGLDGLNHNFLPIPSGFILNSSKEIDFEHITPDYKYLISNDLLIAAAKSLNK